MSDIETRMQQKYEDGCQLLANIKAAMSKLQQIYADTSDHWVYEDGIYRYFHGSYKVYYRLQPATELIVEALNSVSPNGPIKDKYFNKIIKNGTGKTFSLAHNARWFQYTTPMLTAFFMARFMLEMAIKYGQELDEVPQILPSGWAALLYLYGLR